MGPLVKTEKAGDLSALIALGWRASLRPSSHRGAGRAAGSAYTTE